MITVSLAADIPQSLFFRASG